MAVQLEVLGVVGRKEELSLKVMLGLLSYRLPKGIGFDLLVDILDAHDIIPDCRPGNE